MTTPFSPASPGDDRARYQTSTDQTSGDQARGDQAGAFHTDANQTSAFQTATDAATESFFAPNADVPPVPTASTPRLRPRFGTILWGILLLTFATYMVVFTLVPVPPDPTLWLLGGVIAVGLGLVVAGIAAAARRAD